MRHPLLFLIAIFALVPLAACRSTGGFKSAYPAAVLRNEQSAVDSCDQLLALLKDRTNRYDQLWVRAGITVRQPETSRKVFFTAVAMYSAPDKVRLGGSRVPVGTLFDVLINRDKATVFFNREGSLFVGNVDELAQKSGAIGGLSPRDIISAALVQQQLLEVLESTDPCVVENSGPAHLLVATARSTDRNLFFMVRRADGLVEEALVRTSTGAEQLRIRYNRYDLFTNPDSHSQEPLPTEMTLQVRSQGVTINAEVSEYRLKPEFKPAQFAPPRARRTFPMSSLDFGGDL